MGQRTHTSPGNLFLSRVDKDSSPDGCWIWTGRVDKYGYGRGKYQRRSLGAHRIAYLLFVGPLPDGVPLDHTCHDRSCELGTGCMHRRCVNPDHLQLTTVAINTQRGRAGMLSHADYERRGTCRNGHPWVPTNIRMRRVNGEQRRVCHPCERARVARYRAKRRTVAS